MTDTLETEYLVVGGGIAGVSCAEMLYTLDNEASITLVTATSIVKSVSGVNQITKLITQFQVEEQSVEDWSSLHKGVRVHRGKLKSLDPSEHTATLEDGAEIKYRKLCLCTGAQPKLLTDHPLVLGIRDTASVIQLQEKLATARRVVVVGNGGIATELVHELGNVELVWAVKTDAISSVFLDPGASQFLLKEVGSDRDESPKLPSKRLKYMVSKHDPAAVNTLGSALGPDWHKVISKKGSKANKKVSIKYNVTVDEIISGAEENAAFNDDFPVHIRFNDGTVEGADFMISATGVQPFTDIFRGVLDLDKEDGGIKVNDNMQTSCKDVYAAGDICHADWDWSKHWMQMRLWTQARQMGMFAGKCMYFHTIQEPIELDFCFEMFTHSTSFFGRKVILLGLFKSQTLGTDHELLVRVTPDKEYVKVVLKDGRMQGAVLIGETDLEETFENLILNQMDLSDYGEDLLDPDIDIEDYFD